MTWDTDDGQAQDAHARRLHRPLHPRNALADNRYTQAWREFGESVPRPRAILVISGHWYTNATAVTAMLAPRTIHDFYGFPAS